jgi:hypothetical protein
MSKQETQLIVVTGIKLLAAFGVAYVVYMGFNSLFTQDSWPPKDEQEEKEMIAKYIDYEVQKGEKKVGLEGLDRQNAKCLEKA